MYCKKCGTLLTENDKFCKNCGAPVEAQDEQSNVQQLMGSEDKLVSSQIDSVEEPVNNQLDSVQQSMNNQVGLVQEPVNNMQNNYSNNNQVFSQNNNNVGIYQQNKSTSKYIGIGVAAVVVIVGIVFGMKFLGNNGGSNSGDVNSGGNGVSNNVASTYSVKYKGFTFKIPTDLIYEVGSESLFIGDEDDTWQVAIEVINGVFNQLQANKNNLISVYQKAGYGAANVNQKTYGGLDFITVELSHSGQNAILGFTKANSMYVFGVTAFNLDNKFDYNLLTNAAKIFSTAEYSGETNNISSFKEIDMGPVSELVK